MLKKWAGRTRLRGRTTVCFWPTPMAAAQPGGSSVAAWGLGTCSDFTATDDLNKDSQSSEHQEAKEWTKLTEKTDGGAVQCPRTTRELQGTAHCVSVMWLPNPAHFQAVIQEKHRGQGHPELSTQPRI